MESARMMRIWHSFHHLNDFGGAEEHLTTLAVPQRCDTRGWAPV